MNDFNPHTIGQKPLPPYDSRCGFWLKLAALQFLPAAICLCLLALFL